MGAFGKLQELLQQHSPFPDGLILHSWIGPADMVKSLAKLQGVFFSLSGHLTRMSKKKYEPMIKQVANHASDSCQPGQQLVLCILMYTHDTHAVL